ncbi:MAG: hypothetical protein J7K04_00935 [Spirochaetales bacterium]|nr:hypothetical protein [Spirochaetales bacterium]
MTNKHQVTGGPTIEDTICDRIAHSSYRIELKRELVRKLYFARVHEDTVEWEKALSMKMPIL